MSSYSAPPFSHLETWLDSWGGVKFYPSGKTFHPGMNELEIFAHSYFTVHNGYMVGPIGNRTRVGVVMHLGCTMDFPEELNV